VFPSPKKEGLYRNRKMSSFKFRGQVTTNSQQRLNKGPAQTFSGRSNLPLEQRRDGDSKSLPMSMKKNFIKMFLLQDSMISSSREQSLMGKRLFRSLREREMYLTLKERKALLALTPTIQTHIRMSF